MQPCLSKLLSDNPTFNSIVTHKESLLVSEGASSFSSMFWKCPNFHVSTSKPSNQCTKMLQGSTSGELHHCRYVIHQ